MPFSKKLSTLLFYELLSKKTILGNQMYLTKPSFTSWCLARDNIYEETETRFVLDNVKKGDIVLDVGANIGYYTLILAKLVDEQGKVFAFEPEPNNFHVLKKNVRANGYNNVKLERVVVSNKKSKTKLYVSKENVGEHRIYKSSTVSNDYINVEMIRLDDYFVNHNLMDKISFVKMDVEGSELGVLEGMKEILARNKKIKILIEFDPRQIIDYGGKPKDIFDILEKENFDFSYVDRKDKQIKKIGNITLFLEKFDDSFKQTNLICEKIRMC